MSDRDRALGRLRAHRHYDYRGCAPHWDDPRMCAGQDDLPRSVFYGPADGESEGQKDRLAREAAAVALCARCPIRAACRAYAVGDGNRVREPHGIWAGTTPSTRRMEVSRRLAATAETEEPKPLPLALLRTRQKQTVLHALALHDDLAKVEAECGLDDRTVRWQMSRLYTLLRVPADQQDREHLLAAACAAGLLPQPQPEPQPASAVTDPEQAETGTETEERPLRVVVPFRRSRFKSVPGQMDLTEIAPTDAQVIPFHGPGPVNMPQEAAA